MSVLGGTEVGLQDKKTGFLKSSLACSMNLNQNFAGEDGEEMSQIQVSLEGLYTESESC